MQFDFATASRIIFRGGAARDIPALAAGMGRRPCLVTGSNPARMQWLADALAAATAPPLVIPTTGEPDTDAVQEAAGQAREHGCDVVVGVGGGSVMDAAKIIAALMTNTGDIFDYLEVVGKGLPLTAKPMPLITVPTTAGTGSEVTANGVVLSKAHGVKVSLRSTDMIADIAVVDPELTLSLPPGVTAATGMDALTQLIEAFVSTHSNPMTDALCREGMAKAARSLHKACKEGQDIVARTDMALASLFSGIALANAKLGAVHGFAAPLGGQFHVPHGTVCAALLPHVMEVNLRALNSRAQDNRALDAYDEIARIITRSNRSTAMDCIDWIKGLCADLDIPGLSRFGLSESDFPDLARKAADASSMKGNPVVLTDKELLEILARAL
jgi:alcohol dehydrogenase class IV